MLLIKRDFLINIPFYNLQFALQVKYFSHNPKNKYKAKPKLYTKINDDNSKDTLMQ